MNKKDACSKMKRLYSSMINSLRPKSGAAAATCSRSKSSSTPTLYRFPEDMMSVSMVHEALNRIIINIESLFSGERRCLLVTSPSRYDGKTIVSAHLAQRMSKMGYNVLLADCNFRSPGINKLFNISDRAPGLAEAISSPGKWRDYVFPAFSENLNLITTGNVLYNSYGMLGYSQILSVFKEMLRSFDYVLLDTPGVNIVPDTLALARQGVNIILVVRQNHTRPGEIISAANALKPANNPAKCFIFNDIPLSQKDFNLRYGGYNSINGLWDQ